MGAFQMVLSFTQAHTYKHPRHSRARARAITPTPMKCAKTRCYVYVCAYVAGFSTHTHTLLAPFLPHMTNYSQRALLPGARYSDCAQEGGESVGVGRLMATPDRMCAGIPRSRQNGKYTSHARTRTHERTHTQTHSHTLTVRTAAD